MLTPQFVLALPAKLVVDLFAGGGGASTGIEQAIGRPVDIAINHNLDAIGMHEANLSRPRSLVVLTERHVSEEVSRGCKSPHRPPSPIQRQ